MTYRRAKSLDKLVAEVNARFPNRSKTSDGWIGDAAHASRDSDHNPWVKDGDVGVVTAEDITEDDAPGVPEIADFIVKTLVKRRDRRVKYLIHESTIWRSYDKPGIPAWTPAPYSGTNAHIKHVHVSVQPMKSLYDSVAPWGIFPPPAPNPVWYRRDLYLAKPVLTGSDVKHVQSRLVALGHLAARDWLGRSNIDGKWGKRTGDAWGRFQASKHVPVSKVMSAAGARAIG